MAAQDLVTLAQTKAVLVIEHTDDDAVRLPLLITAASKAVLNYLKSGAEAFSDTAGLPILAEVPEEVRVATIYLVGEFYRSPDQNAEGAFEQGFLPKPVTALLYPLRDPAIA